MGKVFKMAAFALLLAMGFTMAQAAEGETSAVKLRVNYDRSSTKVNGRAVNLTIFALNSTNGIAVDATSQGTYLRAVVSTGLGKVDANTTDNVGKALGSGIVKDADGASLTTIVGGGVPGIYAYSKTSTGTVVQSIANSDGNYTTTPAGTGEGASADLGKNGVVVMKDGVGATAVIYTESAGSDTVTVKLQKVYQTDASGIQVADIATTTFTVTVAEPTEKVTSFQVYSWTPNTEDTNYAKDVARYDVLGNQTSKLYTTAGDSTKGGAQIVNQSTYKGDANILTGLRLTQWAVGGYSTGAVVVPTNANTTGYVYVCTANGTGVGSGAEPAWPTTIGATIATADGGSANTQTWTCYGVGNVIDRAVMTAGKGGGIIEVRTTGSSDYFLGNVTLTLTPAKTEGKSFGSPTFANCFNNEASGDAITVGPAQMGADGKVRFTLPSTITKAGRYYIQASATVDSATVTSPAKMDVLTVYPDVPKTIDMSLDRTKVAKYDFTSATASSLGVFIKVLDQYGNLVNPADITDTAVFPKAGALKIKVGAKKTADAASYSATESTLTITTNQVYQTINAQFKTDTFGDTGYIVATWAGATATETTDQAQFTLPDTDTFTLVANQTVASIILDTDSIADNSTGTAHGDRGTDYDHIVNLLTKGLGQRVNMFRVGYDQTGSADGVVTGWREIQATAATVITPGINCAITITSGVVTLTDGDSPFGALSVGDLVRVRGATTATNDGVFKLTAAAAGAISFANANGVAEACAAGTTVSHVNVSAQLITGVVGATETVTTAAAHGFAVGQQVTITDGTNAGGNPWTIASVPSTTTFTVTGNLADDAGGGTDNVCAAIPGSTSVPGTQYGITAVDAAMTDGVTIHIDIYDANHELQQQLTATTDGYQDVTTVTANYTSTEVSNCGILHDVKFQKLLTAGSYAMIYPATSDTTYGTTYAPFKLQLNDGAQDPYDTTLAAGLQQGGATNGLNIETIQRAASFDIVDRNDTAIYDGSNNLVYTNDAFIANTTANYETHLYIGGGNNALPSLVNVPTTTTFSTYTALQGGRVGWATGGTDANFGKTAYAGETFLFYDNAGNKMESFVADDVSNVKVKIVPTLTDTQIFYTNAVGTPFTMNATDQASSVKDGYAILDATNYKPGYHTFDFVNKSTDTGKAETITFTMTGIFGGASDVARAISYTVPTKKGTLEAIQVTSPSFTCPANGEILMELTGVYGSTLDGAFVAEGVVDTYTSYPVQFGDILLAGNTTATASLTDNRRGLSQFGGSALSRFDVAGAPETVARLLTFKATSTTGEYTVVFQNAAGTIKNELKVTVVAAVSTGAVSDVNTGSTPVTPSSSTPTSSTPGEQVTATLYCPVYYSGLSTTVAVYNTGSSDAALQVVTSKGDTVSLGTVAAGASKVSTLDSSNITNTANALGGFKLISTSSAATTLVAEAYVSLGTSVLRAPVTSAMTAASTGSIFFSAEGAIDQWLAIYNLGDAATATVTVGSSTQTISMAAGEATLATASSLGVATSNGATTLAISGLSKYVVASWVVDLTDFSAFTVGMVESGATSLTGAYYMVDSGVDTFLAISNTGSSSVSVTGTVSETVAAGSTALLSLAAEGATGTGAISLSADGAIVADAWILIGGMKLWVPVTAATSASYGALYVNGSGNVTYVACSNPGSVDVSNTLTAIGSTGSAGTQDLGTIAAGGVDLDAITTGTSGSFSVTSGLKAQAWVIGAGGVYAVVGQ